MVELKEHLMRFLKNIFPKKHNSQNFYFDDYKFTPDYSSINDYVFDDKIISGVNNETVYHSVENEQILINEPIYCLKNLKFGGVNFDKAKQMIIDSKVFNILKSHTLMLSRRINGDNEGVASAIYIQYEDKKYILTAGHTFSYYEIVKKSAVLNTP